MTDQRLVYRFADGTRVSFPETWLVSFVHGRRKWDQTTSYPELVEKAARHWREQERMDPTLTTDV